MMDSMRETIFSEQCIRVENFRNAKQLDNDFQLPQFLLHKWN